MEKFEAGDLVRLKSGGPVMVVGSYYYSYDKYDCRWFDGNTLCNGCFYTKLLKAVENMNSEEPKNDLLNDKNWTYCTAAKSSNNVKSTSTLINEINATLETVIIMESKILNMLMPKVSEDEQPDRYPMCKDQPAQIDCGDNECSYHIGSNCTNISPAITLRNGSWYCWSKRLKKKYKA